MAATATKKTGGTKSRKKRTRRETPAQTERALGRREARNELVGRKVMFHDRYGFRAGVVRSVRFNGKGLDVAGMKVQTRQAKSGEFKGGPIVELTPKAFDRETDGVIAEGQRDPVPLARFFETPSKFPPRIDDQPLADEIVPPPEVEPLNGGPAKAPKAKAAKPKPDAGGMTLLDAAEAVLKKAGKPMRCSDITDAAIEQGLWSTSGKTPGATLSAAFGREITTKGKQSRFVKAGRGLFGLKEA